MQAELYQTIVDRLPIGAIVLQLQPRPEGEVFCFTYANQASTHMLGIQLETLIDKPLAAVLPTAADGLLNLYYEILRNGTPQDLGDIYYSGDGIEGYFRIQVSPLTEDAILLVLNNVTKQKGIDAERQKTELALEIYNRKLEASNRELEEFAYVASHDLQEPLRKIMAFGDRLRSKYYTVLDDVGQDYLARMQNAALRMQTLIGDLLNLSRISTRSQAFVPVDLQQIVAEVLKDLETSIEAQGGTIIVDTLPIVVADTVQMRQIFQNLIGNALRFHKPDSRPLIHIGTQSVEREAMRHERLDGEIVEGEAIGSEGKASEIKEKSSIAQTMHTIFVADQGIGFDEKYLNRIFQPFQRLHGASQYEGTGMGLAICRRIIERHGGNITARSQPGQGATFIFSLPAVQPTGEETGLGGIG